MKKMIMILSLLTLLPTNSPASFIGKNSWHKVLYPPYSNDTTTLLSVHAFNQMEAIAVGSGGTVVSIKDGEGGISRSNRKLGDRTFHWVSFFDTLQGWVAGDSGTIYGTTDKGVTWQKQGSLYNTRLNCIVSSGRNCVWAVGDSGLILHSIDGGENWNRRNVAASVAPVSTDLTEPVDFNSVSFRNQGVGCIGGNWRISGRPVLLATCDSGNSWMEIKVYREYRDHRLLEAVVRDSEIWLLFATNGYVPNTTLLDNSVQPGCFAGNSLIRCYGWTRIQNLGFLGLLGYNCRYEGTLHKVSSFPAISNQILHAVDSTESQTIWGVGSNGSIYRTNDYGMNWISIDADGHIPVDNLSSVFFVDSKSGWITGDNGTVLSTGDSGKTWRSVLNPVNSSIAYSHVVFSDVHHGFMIGTRKSFLDQTFLYTTCGDTAPWTPAASWHYGFANVSCLDTNHVLACSYNGDSIVFTFGNGREWEKTSLANRGVAINDVFLATPDAFWVAGGDFGYQGKILKSTDRGKSLDLISSIDQSDAIKKLYRSITFSDPATGWVVGDSGLILKSIDSGYTWQRQSSPARATLTKIRFLNPRFGWTFGGSTIYLTTDGGATWIDKSFLSGIKINDFTCSDTANCWAVGDSGLILHLAYDADYQFFTIISPKNDDSYKTGAPLAVRWLGGATSKVSIAISYDNGATYTTYLTSTDNDGEESIEISANATPSNSCILRIRSADETVQAESERFSIDGGNGVGADTRSWHQQQAPRICGAAIRYYANRETPVAISIFTPSGQMVYKRSIPQQGSGLRIERIPPNLLCNGCYLLRMTFGNRQFIERLIVSR